MTTSTLQLEKIGRYALCDEIGRGAMGVVYRAQDPLIQRTVAVKVLHLPPAFSPDEARIVRERFTREAQTAGCLDHPNIVRIFDVGEEESTGALYIVMEYISGPSLEKALGEQSFDRKRIVDVIGQITSALDCAHAQRIVHRDIKPANILFTEEGVAKLTDFGIARISSSDLTQHARDLGTPVYMSPEQVQGQPLDGKADLFSLGVVCYRLLVGRPPFEGKDAITIAYQVAHSTPLPPSWVDPSIPVEVDAVLERVLAKDPAARQENGREFYEALASALSGGALAPGEADPAGAAPPPARPVRRRALGWAVMGLALSGAAMVALSLRSGGRGDETGRLSVPLGTRPPEATAAGPAGTSGIPAQEAHSLAQEVSPAEERTRTAESTLPQDTGAASAKPRTPSASRSSTRTSTTADRTNAIPAAPPTARLSASTRPKTANAPASGPVAFTISLGHFVQRGNLTVFVDGRAVLAEEFSKGKLTPYQITTWDAMSISSGRHQITARLEAEGREKVYRSEPLEAEFGAGKEVSLRVSIKDEALALRVRAQATIERGR